MTTVNVEHINVSIQEKIRELRNWQGLSFSSGTPLFTDIEESLFRRNLFYTTLNQATPRTISENISLFCYKIWNVVKHFFNYSDHDRLTRQMVINFKGLLPSLPPLSQNPSDTEKAIDNLRQKIVPLKKETEKDKLLTQFAQTILSTIEEYRYTFPITEINPLLNILNEKVSTFSQNVLNPQ